MIAANAECRRDGAAAPMRVDGLFIAVEVDDALAADAELARKLAEVCPVDIFAAGRRRRLEIVGENLDECVLCRLCLDAAPERGCASSSSTTTSAVLLDSALQAPTVVCLSPGRGR